MSASAISLNLPGRSNNIPRMTSTCREPSAAPKLSRRDFVTTSGLALLSATLPGCSTASDRTQHPAPIIDIHQHLNYSDRPDDVLLAHQRAMGITTTILLPAGRRVQL